MRRTSSPTSDWTPPDPAAFLALLWPRLSSAPQRRTAIAGAVIALILIPFVPPGVPIVASMFGVAAALVWPSRAVTVEGDHS